MLSYVIVSPVRDESRYLQQTLDSVLNQSLRPVKWFLVDDGSTDETPAILSRFASSHDFVTVLRRHRQDGRQPGGGVVRAFQYGYDAIEATAYDVVVKLDCDLQFEPDYFQRLIAHFESDEKLGIASGVYCEEGRPGEWRVVDMPYYHAAGACKAVRKKCFEEIRGFVPARGWDTVDEVRAISLGWGTKHFLELQMKHLKPEGTGIGMLRTSSMQGEIFYTTGGTASLFFLKLCKRLFAKPFLVGAAMMLHGYTQAMLRRKPLLVSSEEAACYRRLLWGRVVARTGYRFRKEERT